MRSTLGSLLHLLLESSKTFSEKLLLLGAGADDYAITHPRLDQLKKLIGLFREAGLGKKETKDLLVPVVYNTAKHPGHDEYLKQAALLFTELPDDSRLTRQRIDEHTGFVVRFLKGDEDHMTAAFNKREYRGYIEENSYFECGDNSEEHWEALRQLCREIYNASDIAPSAMTASRGNGDNPSSVSRGKRGVGTGMASGIKNVLSTALFTLLSAGAGATSTPATTARADRTTRAARTTQRWTSTESLSNQPVTRGNGSVINTRTNNASMINATFNTTTTVPAGGGVTIRPTRSASSLSSANTTETQGSGQTGFPTAPIVGTLAPLVVIAGVIGVACYHRDKVRQFFIAQLPEFEPFNLGDKRQNGDGEEAVELKSFSDLKH